MLKKLFMTISLCFILSSCGNGKYYIKYHDELVTKFYNEFANQGICGVVHNETCQGYLFFDGEYSLNIYVYIPKNKELNYDTILNIVNNIYIRDNIDITIIFFKGDKINDFKWNAKKTFKIKYYSY